MPLSCKTFPNSMEHAVLQLAPGIWSRYTVILQFFLFPRITFLCPLQVRVSRTRGELNCCLPPSSDKCMPYRKQMFTRSEFVMALKKQCHLFHKTIQFSYSRLSEVLVESITTIGCISVTVCSQYCSTNVRMTKHSVSLNTPEYFRPGRPWDVLRDTIWRDVTYWRPPGSQLARTFGTCYPAIPQNVVPGSSAALWHWQAWSQVWNGGMHWKHILSMCNARLL